MIYDACFADLDQQPLALADDVLITSFAEIVAAVGYVVIAAVY